MNRKLYLLLFLVLSSALVSAATLKGSIYNSHLDLESNVLVEIDTVPQQKYLATNGTYLFRLPPGNYTLTAIKSEIQVQEPIVIREEGDFIFDLFLLPDVMEEDQLWQETDQPLFTEEEFGQENRTWAYVVAGIIVVLLLYRIFKARRKYGPLGKFRKKHQEESKKTMEQHQQELAQEPGYLEEALKIIKDNEGRITQKKLRREMLHLSEAKISLILTELEHKGKIEKVKKGRGNVILMKEK